MVSIHSKSIIKWNFTYLNNYSTLMIGRCLIVVKILKICVTKNVGYALIPSAVHMLCNEKIII